MTDFWKDIPLALKMTAASVIAIVAIMGYLSTYQTDAEASEYQQKHQSELVAIRIDQLEERISQYRFQLLSGNLTPDQRRWIEDQIKKLEEQIKCIRKGEC